MTKRLDNDPKSDFSNKKRHFQVPNGLSVLKGFVSDLKFSFSTKTNQITFQTDFHYCNSDCEICAIIPSFTLPFKNNCYIFDKVKNILKNTCFSITSFLFFIECCTDKTLFYKKKPFEIDWRIPKRFVPKKKQDPFKTYSRNIGKQNKTKVIVRHCWQCQKRNKRPSLMKHVFVPKKRIFIVQKLLK